MALVEDAGLANLQEAVADAGVGAAGPVNVEEPMADGAVEDAGPVNEKELAKQLKKSKGYYKCGVCQGNPIKHKSSFSRSTHEKLEDTKDERDAWRQVWACLLYTSDAADE